MSVAQIENAIVGAAISYNWAMELLVEEVTWEMFSDNKAARTYYNLQAMHEAGVPIDLLTLSNKMRLEGDLDRVGGIEYLAELSNTITDGEPRLRKWVSILRESYQNRELASLGRMLRSEQTHPDAKIAQAVSIIDRLQMASESHTQKVGDALIAALEKIESVTGGELIGVTSGIQEIDAITSGFQESDLIILAARPSMGKTAAALCFARNAAVRGTPVGIFSLEMNEFQLLQRLIAIEAEVDSAKIRNGKLDLIDWEHINSRIDSLYKAPIYIDDTPYMNISALRQRLKVLKKKHNIGLAVIDYIQLLVGTRAQGREREVADISRGLKLVAKELNIPILALSQLSRAPELRANKRPILSDLRESGSIEQDADMVMFIYRPEYYSEYADLSGADTRGLAEFIIAKQRNGPTGIAHAQFVDTYAKFSNITKEAPPPRLPYSDE